MAYLDGVRVGEATGVDVSAAQILSQTSGATKRLFIGWTLRQALNLDPPPEK